MVDSAWPHTMYSVTVKDWLWGSPMSRAAMVSTMDTHAPRAPMVDVGGADRRATAAARALAPP